MDAATVGLMQAIKSPSLDPDRPPWPYIRCLVRCRILDALRHAKFERQHGDMAAGCLDALADEDAELESEPDEAPPCLEVLMGSLTPRQRDLITRHYSVGESYRKTGRSMGLNPQLIRRHTMDAIKAMRHEASKHVSV